METKPYGVHSSSGSLFPMVDQSITVPCSVTCQVTFVNRGLRLITFNLQSTYLDFSLPASRIMKVLVCVYAF